MEYIVSACLAGIKCRYNGSDCGQEAVKTLVEKGIALPLCPEILGSLPIPRTKAELRRSAGGTRVISETGEDLTGSFLNGAKKTLQIAETLGIKKAILKSGSPSCGKDTVYDGSFSGILVPGEGITAKVLREAGINLFSETDLQELQNCGGQK